MPGHITTRGWADVRPRPSVELIVAFAQSSADKYDVTATAADASGAASIHLPVMELAVESASISRSGRAARSSPVLAVHTPPPPPPQPDVSGLGQRLFESVFVGPVLTAYRAARAAAESKRAGLQLALDLSRTPELLPIPWEALCDDPLFLATQLDVSVIRRVSTSEPLPLIGVAGAVRVLGVIANPRSDRLDSLDVDAERRRVTDSLAPLLDGGLVTLDWLQPATSDGLQEALNRDYHVLHYIGHSAAAEGGDEATLILQSADGTPAPLTGTKLANMVGRGGSLRLVLLNSCESAVTVEGDPFSAVATQLVKLGIPAVVAMQYRVSDAAAVIFSSALYGAMVSGLAGVLAEAVAAARLELLLRGFSTDWVAPVVFLQATDAQLFDTSLVGWYTLDGGTPARTPPPGRAGFLGLTLFDPFERAVAMLGDSYEEELPQEDGLTDRSWVFQGQSRVVVTRAANEIQQLFISIDPDEHGPLRVSLPYGILLGGSTMAEADAAIRAPLDPEWGGGANIGPVRRSISGEGVTLENWIYLCPDSPEGTWTIEVGTSISWDDPNYAEQIDCGSRTVSSFCLRLRNDITDWDPEIAGAVDDEDEDTGDTEGEGADEDREYLDLLEQIFPGELDVSISTASASEAAWR